MRWQNVRWLVIITMCYGNRIFDASEFHNPQLSRNKMSDLIKLCLLKRINPIVITANLVDKIYRVLPDVDYLNINVIDHKYRSKQIQISNPAKPTYIISIDSVDQLKALLDSLMSSPTWSTTSVFYIIEIQKNFCGNASNVLQILWKMNLISAIYVCDDPNGKEMMMLYTYNPFTNWASKPWMEVELINKPDNRWTIFKQPFTGDYRICQSLTFDKTKFLDGYTVRATGESLKNDTRKKFYSIDSLEKHLTNDFEIVFFRNLFATMNVTPIIQYGKPGIWAKNTAYGYLTSIMNRTIDISLDPRYLNEYPYVGMVKVHREAFSLILTQPIFLLVTVENFAHFLNPIVISIIVIILLITFIVLILNNNRDYGYGFLEVIRLSISAGLTTPLDSVSIRMIFLTTTFFVFFMSPAIQGQIFSNSAIPDRHHPRNLKDLHDFKFNVYHYFRMKDFFAEYQLWRGSDQKYLHPMSHLSRYCHEQVLVDSSNACLTPMIFQYRSIKKHRNLHLAKTKIDRRFISYWIKKDWVLKDVIDKIATSFSESGFFYLWDEQELQLGGSKLGKKNRLRGFEIGFNDINYENLFSVHAIMVSSFVLSTFIFIFEWAITKYRTVQYKKIIIETLEQRVEYVRGRLVLRK